MSLNHPGSWNESRLPGPQFDVRTLIRAHDPSNTRGGDQVLQPIAYEDDRWNLNGHGEIGLRHGRISFLCLPGKWRAPVKNHVLLRTTPTLALDWGSGPLAKQVANKRRVSWMTATRIPVQLAPALHFIDEYESTLGPLRSEGWPEVLRWLQTDGRAPQSAPGMKTRYSQRTLINHINELRLFYDWQSIHGHSLPFDRPWGNVPVNGVVGAVDWSNRTASDHKSVFGLGRAYLNFFNLVSNDILDRVQWWSSSEAEASEFLRTTKDPWSNDPYLQAGGRQVDWLPSGDHLVPVSGQRWLPNHSRGLWWWLNRLTLAAYAIIATLTGLRERGIATIGPGAPTDDGAGRPNITWWQNKAVAELKERSLPITTDACRVINWVRELRTAMRLPQETHDTLGVPLLFSSSLIKSSTPTPSATIDSPLSAKRQRLILEALQLLTSVNQGPDVAALRPQSGTVISQTVLATFADEVQGDIAVQAIRHHSSIRVQNGYLAEVPRRLFSGRPARDYFPYAQELDEEIWRRAVGPALSEALSDSPDLSGPAVVKLREYALSLEARTGSTKTLSRMVREGATVRIGTVAICTSLEGGLCSGLGPTHCVWGCPNAVYTPANRAFAVYELRIEQAVWGKGHPFVTDKEAYVETQCSKEALLSDRELIVLMGSSWDVNERAWVLDWFCWGA